MKENIKRETEEKYGGSLGSVALGWVRIVFGLAVFALGVHLTIRADIGLAPWDCLGMGIAAHTPLNYGLSMTAMSVIILVIDILLKEKIGFGTIIDALLTGNFVQLFNDIDPFPETKNLFAAIAIIIAGLALMAIGQYFYMTSAQGCGPRDSLLVGLGKRLRRLPIGVVQIIIWATVLLTGWLLGGPVGIGTVVSTFGSGIVMQIVYSIIKFEPRKIVHRSVVETVKQLRGTG
ncbi:MAG: hypothetical protein IJS90_05995 [Clostridia bacterium]|nr:hypothetical protein [Clostridia bacterium]